MKHRSVRKKIVGIKSIRKVGTADVYCLASEKNGTMIVNGIVTRQCDALRYAIFSRFYNDSVCTMTTQDANRLERLYGNKY